MKTDNMLLIYDDLCPLCTWYSGLFVRLGLLEAEGRVAFSQAPAPLLSLISLERGKNEIPLVDPATRKVYYGIDALLTVLAQKFPWVKSTANIQPINWALRKLYKLISFNRKVIVAQKCGKGRFDCSPEFNVPYRMAFMLIFLLFNSAMLLPIHRFVFSNLSFYHLNFWQLESAHLLFVFSNCLLALFLPRSTAIEYLGQVNMLALFTILLCIPLMLLCKLLPIGDAFIVGYLVLVLLFVVKEYYRRMNYTNVLEQYKLVARINFLCMAIFIGYLFI
jgi:hypothetical protein